MPDANRLLRARRSSTSQIDTAHSDSIAYKTSASDSAVRTIGIGVSPSTSGTSAVVHGRAAVVPSRSTAASTTRSATGIRWWG